MNGQILPDFHLPAVDDRHIRLSDYRNRRNLVLIVVRGLSASSDKLLSTLAQQAGELEADNAQALVVVRGPIQAAASLQRMYSLSCPVLADEAGVTETLLGQTHTDTAPRLAVHIANRSAQVYWSAWVSGHDSAPTMENIRSWLEFIEIQCPECEAPEWSAP